MHCCVRWVTDTDSKMFMVIDSENKKATHAHY